MTQELRPSDHVQRRAILEDLDTTMLVEAAAGTGKTTSMVGRMVRLLASGRCRPENLAAVTFTRKAAAELRLRFRSSLRDHVDQSKPVEQERIRQAILRSDGCFIGTIHSFCAYLLRERPIEAGISLNFQEIDDAEDTKLREEAWHEYVRLLYEDQDSVLLELDRIGVEIEDLKTAYLKLCDFQDIEKWPTEQVPLPQTDPVRRELADYVRHMEQLLRTFPERPERDDLMNLYELVVLMHRQSKKSGRIHELMEILDRFRNKKGVGKRWPGGIDQCKAEMERLKSFIERIAEPTLRVWRRHRYESLMRVLLAGVSLYGDLKRQRGKLNFQDLLLFTARMLKENPSVRAHFRGRFSHILIDEFQDTDPIQAEVVMLMTSRNHSENDWKKCRPIPGSLFVVGDPKQSIYRFRRADIVTYNQVKTIILAHGGRVVTLSANFRAVEPLIDWVNNTFEDAFDGLPRQASPAYVALQPVKRAPESEGIFGVRCIRVPADLSKGEKIASYDAQRIARIIADVLSRGLRMSYLQSRSSDGGGDRIVNPSDFLIITPRLKNLQVYAKALQDEGIPFEVTGSTSLNEIPELSLLNNLLWALLEPHNPIPLVAVLRGPLFGMSDSELYEFKRAGGRFCYRSPVPSFLQEELRCWFEDAFGRMERYRLWLAKMPPVTALEKIAHDSGLAIRSALGTGGNMNAGGFLKAIELLRERQSKLLTLHDLQKSLQVLSTKDEEHDNIAALGSGASSVKLMNLHKAKGLEAPFVFLADPTGHFDHEPLIFIDRSGETVKGYLTVQSKPGLSRKPQLLAEPPDWEELVRQEKSFQDAEFLRFLYVAATRAGCVLTVSLTAKKVKNPWAFFEATMEEVPEWIPGNGNLDDGHSKQPLSLCELEEARLEIERRWSVVRATSYDVGSVKARTVLQDEGAVARRKDGTEWGLVIHSLLEMAMKRPGEDLQATTLDLLDMHGFDAGSASECIEVVTRVMDSEIWKRACASPKVFVETPFQILQEMPLVDGVQKPLLLRGIIDLVFEEPDGWVLIDYKTDKVSEEFLPALVEKYREQVFAYSRAWLRVVGGRMKEQGLFFTHLCRYVTLAADWKNSP